MPTFIHKNLLTCILTYIYAWQPAYVFKVMCDQIPCLSKNHVENGSRARNQGTMQVGRKNGAEQPFNPVPISGNIICKEKKQTRKTPPKTCRHIFGTLVPFDTRNALRN